MADLKPANENPWYVLATLYGEQEGEEVDWELHEKNRKVWNLWAQSRLSDAQKEELRQGSTIPVFGRMVWGTTHSSIESKFRSEWCRRNGDDPEPARLPNPLERIDLGETRFEKLVVLEKCYFPSATDFGSASFEKNVLFADALFATYATFSRTYFAASAWFEETGFSGTASFDQALARGSISFVRAKFSSTGWFDAMAFHGFALFTRAQFGADVHFNQSKFYGLTEFHGACFEGRAFYSDARFGGGGVNQECEPVFTDCQFDQPVTFRDAVFLDGYPLFEGTVLHPKTVFTAKNGNWPEDTEQDLEQARDSCAAIRHVLGQQGLPEDEHFFFRREMRFAGQVGPWWARVPYQAFGVLSDYGISIARPVTFLATTYVLPLGAYTAIFENRGGTLLDSALSALGLSLASTLKFFGFQRLYFGGLFKDADFWIALLTGTQTVLGYVFLFFLALGLRQRFRLR